MGFNRLLNIMDTLLGENGCPWDRAQTIDSIRPYLLEECGEAVEAIDNSDMESLSEEIGDVLLQVVFISKLAERAGSFNMDDVLNGLCEKLIRRHSHVFGEDRAISPEDALRLWNENKMREKL